jgi:hypothetical protein
MMKDSYLFHSQVAVFHNHLFHLRNHVFRSVSAWPRSLRFVFTRHSAFFELSYSWMQIFHIHNAIIACLTQLLMNFDRFHTMQVEESEKYVLFFKCKRCHFQYLKHLSFDITCIQWVGQCCRLASPNLKNSHVFSNNFHVSTCFHFREKKSEDHRTWMHHVPEDKNIQLLQWSAILNTKWQKKSRS